MSEPMTAQPATGRGKDKTIAGILGILLGSLGVHHFYLGSNGAGFVLLGVSIASYVLSMVCIGLLFIWIPPVVGIIEGIMLLLMADTDFNARYNDRAPQSMEFVFMKPKG